MIRRTRRRTRKVPPQKGIISRSNQRPRFRPPGLSVAAISSLLLTCTISPGSRLRGGAEERRPALPDPPRPEVERRIGGGALARSGKMDVGDETQPPHRLLDRGPRRHAQE